MITDHHFDISDSQTTRANKAPATKMTNYESLRQATDAFQRDYVGQVINDNRGNWANAARALNIDSGNSHRLAKRLGLK